MNYTETLRYLYENLPMYQRSGAPAYKANLDNTLALDQYFGHPHRQFRSIHVAGTNGKGSVSHMLAAILQSAGYRTGLYTSPHLKDFRERIRINGIMIAEHEVVEFVEKNLPVMEKVQPSFFEITVMMAFGHFARRGAELAVIETGMGGRLDSTNIIDPLISVITNIGLDHTRFLGDTLEKIAVEKAGIIKPDRPVVIGEKQEETTPVFEKIAAEKNARLIFAADRYQMEYSLMTPERKQVFHIVSGNKSAYQGLVSGLTGIYQQKNVPTVLASTDILRETGLHIPDRAVYEGIENVSRLTGFHGRWEEIGHDPLIVCDAAHNPDGVREVVRQLSNTPYRRLLMVWGMVSDKDITSILRLLPSNADYYFTRAGIPRALDEHRLHQQAEAAGLHGRPYPTVQTAISEAKKAAGKDDMIFIGGSTFIVAEAL